MSLVRSISQRKISVVVPVMNEEECLPQLVGALTPILRRLTDRYEIVLVDDGSVDGTFSIISMLAQQDRAIVGVKLSRNAGHQQALECGIRVASGDVVVTMDGDLQHPPTLIPQMVEAWERGFDVVNTERRMLVGARYWERHFSKTFYALFNRISNIELVPGGSDFRLLDRRCVDALNAMKEHFKFFRGQVRYIGFTQCSIQYDCQSRFAGSRSYSLGQSLRMAVDGMLGFSTFGLKLPIYAGTLTFIVIAAYMLVVAVKAVMGHPVEHVGWLSAIVLIAMVFAFIFFYMGIIGLYLSKIFVEVKNRPAYFVDRICKGADSVQSDVSGLLLPRSEVPGIGVGSTHWLNS